MRIKLCVQSSILNQKLITNIILNCIKDFNSINGKEMSSFPVSHANPIVSVKGKEQKPPVSHQGLNGSPAIT